MLFHEKNYVGAELALDHCVELRREYPRAYELRGQAILGHALELLGSDGLATSGPGDLAKARFKRALENYKTALRKAPNDPITFWSQGDLFVQLERKNALDVLKEYAGALGRSPDCLDAYGRAMDLEDEVLEYAFRRNRLEEARDLAEKRAREDPKNADILAVLAQAYLLLKKPDRSLAVAKRALDVSPHHDRALAVLGTVYLGQGRSDEALECFSEALEKAPSNYLAASGRARALEELEQYTRANDAYDYLLSTPSNSEFRVAVTNRHLRAAHEGRARVLLKLGRRLEAAGAERTARQIDIAEGLRRSVAPETGNAPATDP